jgi:hypothetical protein
MEKVDYNEKERLAWSSYVFLERQKTKQNKKNLVGYRQYHMAPPKTATTSTTPTKRSNHQPAKKTDPAFSRFIEMF